MNIKKDIKKIIEHTYSYSLMKLQIKLFYEIMKRIIKLFLKINIIN